MRADREGRAAAPEHAGGLGVTETIPRNQDNSFAVFLAQLRDRLTQKRPLIRLLCWFDRSGTNWGRIVRYPRLERVPSALGSQMVGQGLARGRQQPRERVTRNIVQASPTNEKGVRHDVLGLLELHAADEGVVEDVA